MIRGAVSTSRFDMHQIFALCDIRDVAAAGPAL
jgi:hypothetical protein